MKYKLMLSLLVAIIGCDQKEYVVERADDGSKISEGYKLNNLKQGVWVFYDDKQDTLYLRHYKQDTLFLEYSYYQSVVDRRVKYNGEGQEIETYIYYPSGEVQGISYPIENTNKGVSISLFENGQPKSLNFYLLSDERGVYKTNQKITDNFIQFHENGSLYASTQSFNENLFNIYDTTGVLVYKVNFTTGDTLYKAENHKAYFIPPAGPSN